MMQDAGKTLFRPLVATLFLLSSGQALAVDNLSITIATTPIALGKLVRSNSTATTFTVTSTGSVSATTSAGVRVTTANPGVLSVTVDCVQDLTTTKCSRGGKSYTFTISPNTATGGGTLQKFSYGSISSSGSLTGSAPAAASPLSFGFQIASGRSWPVTFTLGYEYLVSTNAARGAASAPYTVTVTQN